MILSQILINQNHSILQAPSHFRSKNLKVVRPWYRNVILEHRGTFTLPAKGASGVANREYLGRKKVSQTIPKKKKKIQLLYCLLHYRGDENIKGFIWDLISPAENGKTKELQNHSGDYQVFAFHLFIGYLILFRSKGFSQSKSSMYPLSQVCLSLCPVDARGKK